MALATRQNSKGIISIIIIGISLLTVDYHSAAAQSSAPTGKITPEFILQWNGSGCSKQDEKLAASGGSGAIKKDFDSRFTVRRAPGVRLAESRKNCALILLPPKDQEIALEKVDLHGDVKLSTGMKLSVNLEVSSQGESASKVYSMTDPQPGDTTFQMSKAVEEKDQLWSKCGRALTANLKQRIEGAGKESAEAKMSRLQLAIKTRPCAKP